MSYKTPGIGETNYCTASSSCTLQPQWMFSLLGFFFPSAFLAGHQPWWPGLLEENSHSPGLHLWVSEVAWAYEGEMTKRKSSTQRLCLFSDAVAKYWQWSFIETWFVVLECARVQVPCLWSLSGDLDALLQGKWHLHLVPKGGGLYHFLALHWRNNFISVWYAHTVYVYCSIPSPSFSPSFPSDLTRVPKAKWMSKRL